MHAWAEVCRPLQSSKSPLTGFLCSIVWRITGFLQTLPHTNSISNSAILRNNYISLLSDLCACVHVNKRWGGKGSHSSSVSKSPRVTSNLEKRLASALLSEKCCETIMKESHKFELARLKKKKKKKEKHFGRLVTFWFGTFAMLFSATGCVFVIKTLEDER